MQKIEHSGIVEEDVHLPTGRLMINHGEGDFTKKLLIAKN